MAANISDEALDKLLAELPSGEENKAEEKPITKEKKPEFKHEKPEWADKKNDDYNTYDYTEKEMESDNDW